MATYSFTPAAVLAENATVNRAIAGEAISAGDFIYLDASDGNKAKRAECGDVVEKATVTALAINSAAVGQPVNYVVTGTVTVDADTFATIGGLLALAPTAGACMDVADLATGNFVTLLGWATAANKLSLQIRNTKLQQAAV